MKRWVRALCIVGGLLLVGSLAVNCVIDHKLVFDTLGTAKFPLGFNCEYDGGTKPRRYIEAALFDGGKSPELSFTLVADFFSVHDATGNVEPECYTSRKADMGNCTVLPNLRSCLEVDNIPATYGQGNGVALTVDGGLNTVLERLKWNLTAHAQPPDSDVFMRIVALAGVSCEHVPTGAAISENDFYDDVDGHLADQVVGCIYSSAFDLHNSEAQILLSLPATDGRVCDACNLHQCTSAFQIPSCNPDMTTTTP